MGTTRPCIDMHRCSRSFKCLEGSYSRPSRRIVYYNFPRELRWKQSAFPCRSMTDTSRESSGPPLGALLAKKYCVVTGACRGIGRAIAEAFAAQKAKLILASLDPQALQEAAQVCLSLGADDVYMVPGDLSKGEEVDKLAQAALERSGGRVYMLVNNAAMVLGFEDVLQGNPDDWETLMRLNLLAPMRLTHRLAPGMVEAGEGVIIDISSVAGISPHATASAYSTSKVALNGWHKCCHKILAEKGIKKVVICPAVTNTDMASKTGTEPSRRIQPSDVAEAALLAVRLSRHCCPEEIVLDNIALHG